MRIRGTQVSVNPSGLAVVTTTDVQAALAELDAAVDGLGSGGGGGGSAWTLDVDLPGATATGFTAANSATFTSDGTVWTLARSGDHGRAVYNTPLSTAPAGIMFEVEMEVPASGFIGDGSKSAGIVLTNSTGSAGGYCFRLDGDNNVRFERDGQANLGAVSRTHTAGWVTVRMLLLGGHAAAWIDGTLVHSMAGFGVSGAGWQHPAMYVFNTTIRYRNLKVWAVTLP